MIPATTLWRLVNGDTLISLLLAVVGAYWMYAAIPLGFWQGFAPGSGFLPFCYGLLLVGFSIVILVRELVGNPDFLAVPQESPAKPFILIVLIALSIIGIQTLGFVPTIFLLMLIIFAVVERQSWLPSFANAAGIALFLHILFRVWLGVPLPAGPLGI